MNYLRKENIFAIFGAEEQPGYRNQHARVPQDGGAPP
jgi:hypothetical protein